MELVDELEAANHDEDGLDDNSADMDMSQLPSADKRRFHWALQQRLTNARPNKNNLLDSNKN